MLKNQELMINKIVKSLIDELGLNEDKIIQRTEEIFKLRLKNFKLDEDELIKFINSTNTLEFLNESTTTNTSGVESAELDTGPATWYKDYPHYKKEANKVAELIGMQIVDYLVGNSMGSYSNIDDFAKAIPVSYYPAGVLGLATPTNNIDWKGRKAYNAWKAKVKNLVKGIGFKFVEFLSKEELQGIKDTSYEIKGKEDIIKKESINDKIVNGSIKEFLKN